MNIFYDCNNMTPVTIVNVDVVVVFAVVSVEMKEEKLLQCPSVCYISRAILFNKIFIHAAAGAGASSWQDINRSITTMFSFTLPHRMRCYYTAAPVAPHHIRAPYRIALMKSCARGRRKFEFLLTH